jgi:HK97 gp10 family phage protein
MTARITAGNKEVDYAKYVEFGTRRSRAQPFLRTAKAQAREQLPQVLKGALRRQDIFGGGR